MSRELMRNVLKVPIVVHRSQIVIKMCCITEDMNTQRNKLHPLCFSDWDCFSTNKLHFHFELPINDFTLERSSVYSKLNY